MIKVSLVNNKDHEQPIQVIHEPIMIVTNERIITDRILIIDKDRLGYAIDLVLKKGDTDMVMNDLSTVVLMGVI